MCDFLTELVRKRIKFTKTNMRILMKRFFTKNTSLEVEVQDKETFSRQEVAFLNLKNMLLFLFSKKNI